VSSKVSRGRRDKKRERVIGSRSYESMRQKPVPAVCGQGNSLETHRRPIGPQWTATRGDGESRVNQLRRQRDQTKLLRRMSRATAIAACRFCFRCCSARGLAVTMAPRRSSFISNICGCLRAASSFTTVSVGWDNTTVRPTQGVFPINRSLSAGQRRVVTLSPCRRSTDRHLPEFTSAVVS
jgi:hypothetical protein